MSSVSVTVTLHNKWPTSVQPGRRTSIFENLHFGSGNSATYLPDLHWISSRTALFASFPAPYSSAYALVSYPCHSNTFRLHRRQLRSRALLHNTSVLLSHRSLGYRKEHIVIDSSCYSEYITLHEASHEAIFPRQVLSGPTPLYCDNHAAAVLVPRRSAKLH
ncbi:hypothetical protein BGW80DRAFT_99830 [Lactifluus volemus]|nr:hypothetical protein BGW80DRAFT_99830 [Lactifluus volemus]